MKSPLRILLGLCLLAASPSISRCADKDEVLILSFFRANGQLGTFFAASEDGLHFKALNNDQPAMKPAPWDKQNLTRDPSVVYHDGLFRMVWTTGWKGNCFGYAESKDLVTWSEPVRVEPFPASAKQPANTWAPEITWDPVQKNFMIVWSSGGKLYVTRTSDGKKFTEAKQFIEPGFKCIDAMSVFDETAAGKRWVTIYKNEEKPEAGGKNLRVATAPADFGKPWAMVETPIIGQGSSVGGETMAEGPSLLKRKDGWFLYWDAPLNNTFAMASSPDLKTWTNRTAELELPPHPRHGTVFSAPRSAVGWLK